MCEPPVLHSRELPLVVRVLAGVEDVVDLIGLVLIPPHVGVRLACVGVDRVVHQPAEPTRVRPLRQAALLEGSGLLGLLLCELVPHETGVHALGLLRSLSKRNPRERVAQEPFPCLLLQDCRRERFLRGEHLQRPALLLEHSQQLRFLCVSPARAHAPQRAQRRPAAVDAVMRARLQLDARRIALRSITREYGLRVVHGLWR
mmetsp:Transcript_66002/g.137482  ORF Transcript_66002/g.137482 Transcript_66002/m.137482 type:complete len:202 (-) Transcript_66002:141-746(-)